jgi:acyl-CoA thioester hydrolase
MHTFPVTVYYADTDAGGVVYHARYLEFFERARFDWLDSLEKGSAIPTKERGGFVVSEISVKYREPAQLGDHLKIQTKVQNVQRASISLEQHAMSAAGKAICQAVVTLVKINGNWKPEPLPEFIRNKVSA